MSKILLIDIDGTLVDYENRLPVSAVDAIRKARANGHRVYLCSGRSKAENKQDGKEQCGQFFHVHDFLSKMEYSY